MISGAAIPPSRDCGYSGFRKREERATACSPAEQIQRNSNNAAARYRGLRSRSRSAQVRKEFPARDRANRSSAARSDLPRPILPRWRGPLYSTEFSTPDFFSASNASGSRSFPDSIQPKARSLRARSDSRERTTRRAREEPPAIERPSARRDVHPHCRIGNSSRSAQAGGLWRGVYPGKDDKSR